MSATGHGVPDLLRRFAPAAHHVHTHIAGIEISMDTNDVEIATKMQHPVAEVVPGKLYRATIIRDPEAPVDISNVAVISAPPLTTLLVGTGTVIVLESELREILGFLASSVPAQYFADELLPLLLNRSKDVLSQKPAEHISTSR